MVKIKETLLFTLCFTHVQLTSAIYVLTVLRF